MKKQMIKLSVIAAVLSGMAFTASAVTLPVVPPVELNMHALVQAGACVGSVANQSDTHMDWGTFLLSELPVTAKPDTIIPGANPKTVKIDFADCQGDLTATQGVHMMAIQSGADADVASQDLWGVDKDKTGVAFMIKAKVGPAGQVPLKQDQDLELVAPGNPNVAKDIVVPSVVLEVSPVTYIDGDKAKEGSVSSVVFLSAVEK